MPKVLCLSVNHPAGDRWSKSFNTAFSHLNMDYVYVPIHVKNIPTALKNLRSFDVRFANVSLLLDETTRAYFDQINESVEVTDVINFVANKDNKLTAYNTASIGFEAAIKELTSIKGKRFVMVGAGRVARSLAWALQKVGGDLTIVSRDVGKAKAIADKFGAGYASISDVEKIGDFDVLINATNVGMFPNTNGLAVPKELIRSGKVCFDVIMKPIETEFLKQAKAMDCKIISGYEMFAWQSVLQLKIAENKDVPIGLIKDCLLSSL